MALVGLGGLGGILLEGLARLGFGRIRVADHDCFEPSNLNRQVLAQTDSPGTPQSCGRQPKGGPDQPPPLQSRLSSSASPLTASPPFFAGADLAIDALGGADCRMGAQQGAAQANVPLLTRRRGRMDRDGGHGAAGSKRPCEPLSPGSHTWRLRRRRAGLPGSGPVRRRRSGAGRSSALGPGTKTPRLGGPDGQMVVIDLDHVSMERFSL